LEITLLFTCGLLLVGLLLRARIRLLQMFYVPAAIIGGLIGLAVLHGAQAAGRLGLTWIPDQAAMIVDVLRPWPGWLIAIVFAGLFLDKPGKSLIDSLRGAARQGNMVWIICMGQVGLGLAAVWMVIQPLHLAPFEEEVPIYFGQLIEAGFVGGHGTSAALGEVYAKLGFAEAKDLAFFMATVGLIYSVVSGVFFVNLGVRRGWTRAGRVQMPRLSGLEARRRSECIGLGKVNAEVLDPLVFQALILAAAYAAGLALQKLVGLAYDGLPLFMFTLIGGWLVRDAMRLLGIADLIDPETMRRLVAGAMEFLIVAAIASLNLNLVARAIVPLSILLVVAFAWTAVCLLYIGRRLLPSAYWFELGIINYGMSTGVTASGLMLLRIIDKDFDSGAAEDYALAAPLSSPFVGGGVVTVLVFPGLLQSVGVGPTALIALAVTVGLYGLGLAMANRRTA
jgi:ESS family glutamate:Na+ symporter